MLPRLALSNPIKWPIIGGLRSGRYRRASGAFVLRWGRAKGLHDMKTMILFPSRYFDLSKPETTFEAEYRAVLDTAGLDARLCNFDEFSEGLRLKLDEAVGESVDCIWRGWMMLPEQYARFHGQCRQAGLRLITDPAAYELMHCFPNAYGKMDAGDTPRIEVFGDRMSADVINGCFDAFMMKDFVKSVKQTGFPQRIETPLTQDECDRLSEEFIRLRGDLFAGGIVCKQHVELKVYGPRTNEWRGFYFKGKLLNLSGNSMQFPPCPPPPAAVAEAGPFTTLEASMVPSGGIRALPLHLSFRIRDCRSDRAGCRRFRLRRRLHDGLKQGRCRLAVCH